MIGKYYVVTLNCGTRKVPNDAIERALAQPYDWLRFSPNCYFVYAYASSPQSIYNLLKPLLDAQDLILIVPIDPSPRYGWTSKLAVDWFNKFRA